MRTKENKEPMLSKHKLMENEVFHEYMELRKVKGSMKMPIYEYLGKKYNRTPGTIHCIVARVAKRLGVKRKKL